MAEVAGSRVTMILMTRDIPFGLLVGQDLLEKRREERAKRGLSDPMQLIIAEGRAVKIHRGPYPDHPHARSRLLLSDLKD